MAHSLRSAGKPVQLPASVAQPGNKPAHARRRSAGDWVEESSTPVLLVRLADYLKKIRTANELAYDAARDGQGAPARAAGSLSRIEDLLCDEAFLISAGDVVKQLAKRARAGSQHA
jgi:hypothetical protein